MTAWFRLLVGLLIGVIGLIAMVRLISGGFPGSVLVAELFAGLAMVPWVIYAGWRARHGRLTPRTAVPVVLVGLAGLASVWWGTIGPVLALACSLTGFVIIWVYDLPSRRKPSGRLVRLDDLQQRRP
ncbi:hypothetical protein [Microlunatus sp. Gsoil 973]|uniref:hypothetical protein n=1 Tax=Microlunatus sp. Gsoil 973 TaxID=2672569 RepID=UPI0012B4FF5A|nr:hypothetical protein [Microlunatus sp. Gsoil 973]QGN31884.1 hypothetical protein GJV80_02605 [Microlunatus sp. Gsoil 973]